MINHLKLNLASGMQRLTGFYNIDKVKTSAVDYVMDLEVYPWDIESNSCEHLICNHYIEHISHDTYSKRLVRLIQSSTSWEDFQSKVREIDLDAPSDGLILFMEEVYRILTKNGVAEFTVPYYLGDIAWRDPTHQRAITETTFLYFNRQWRVNSGLEHYGIECDFKVKIKNYGLYKDQDFKNPGDKETAVRYYNNVIATMQVELRKIVSS